MGFEVTWSETEFVRDDQHPFTIANTEKQLTAAALAFAWS